MDVTIEKLVNGGDGMGYARDKAVFVPLALPGETHRIEIIQEKKRFIRGESLEMIDGGGSFFPRIEPTCPLFGRCGGCNLQHLSYDNQLQFKRDSAINDYFHLGGIDFGKDGLALPNILPSREFGYRNRAQFHRKQTSVGFMKRRSRHVQNLSHCPLLADGLNEFLRKKKGKDLPEKERFILFGTEGRYWTEGIDGRVDIELMGKPVSFAPGLFFQSNLSMVEPVIRDIADFAGTGESLLDLYGGVGLFSLFLEDRFSRILVVESSRGAKKWGLINLKHGEYREITVEKWSKNLDWKDKIDFLVVDPPRSGLSSAAVNLLNRLKPKKMAYVSCNPVTQARDLKLLLSAGHRLRKITLYDFYPQTSHLESVALMESHD